MAKMGHTSSSSSSTKTTGATHQSDDGISKSRYQTVYGAFGFSKAYNFPLFIIFAGAMFGFSLSRLEDYNFDHVFSINIAAGDWYWYHAGRYRVGMLLHLGGVLPAGLLMVLQFVPAIRHRVLLFHRINGYTVLLLLLVSNAGACIILPRSAGGIVATQTALAVLVILTTTGMVMAHWNIKRLQIDQHRAWMLRTMFYFGVIITTRLITYSGAAIISRMGGYYTVWSCDQVNFTYKQFGVEGILQKKYPQCLQPNGTLDGMVVIEAAWDLLAPEQLGADTEIPFSVGLWIALLLHLIGVELYLNLTPRESKRLRQISYEKQLEAGFKNPGFAGWNVNRWGDAEEWKPNRPAS